MDNLISWLETPGVFGAPLAALAMAVYVMYSGTLREWATRTALALVLVGVQLLAVILTDFPFGLAFPPFTAMFVMIPSGYWLTVLLARTYPEARFFPAWGVFVMWLPVLVLFVYGSTWK